MKKPKSVTSLQLVMSIGTAIIGVGILAFPRITVEYVATGAPLSTLFGMLMMMCGGVVLAYLGNQYNEATIFEYADRLLGRWLSCLFALAIAAYFLELAALASREFGEVVVTSVLQRTPIAVTVFVMIVLATLAVRCDIAVFVRILTFYMPLVYFPALIIVILSLKSAKLVNLLPLMGLFYGQDPRNILMSILVVAALFQNYMIVGMIVPFMYRPNEAMKSTLLGMTVAGTIYMILIYSTLAVFGTEEIRNLLWPTLELAKTAALPEFFIERLDPIFLAVWVTAVFSAIFAAYYLAVQALSHVFHFSDHRPFSFLTLPIIITLAHQPANIVVLYQIIKRVGVTGLTLTLAYPCLLFLVHLFQKGRKRKMAKSEASL